MEYDEPEVPTLERGWRMGSLRAALAFHLPVGEAADCKAYDTLIALPERTPKALLADAGYDANAMRADLASRSITYKLQAFFGGDGGIRTECLSG